MQAWASILGSALRKSLPRSTLARLWKQWIESTAQSPWEAEVEWGGRGNHDCFIHTIHSGQFQVRWGSMANLNFFFFLPKKSTSSWHTNVSFELGPVIWFLCVNTKIQRKDNVLKSSEVELHWFLALLSPSEAPTLFPWTLSSHRSTQSWDTSPSYSPIKTFVECLLHPWRGAPWWLSGGTVVGSFPHRVYNLTGT